MSLLKLAQRYSTSQMAAGPPNLAYGFAKESHRFGKLLILFAAQINLYIRS